MRPIRQVKSGVGVRMWGQTNHNGDFIYSRLDGPCYEGDDGSKCWSYIGSSSSGESSSALVRAIRLEREVYHLTKLVERLAKKVEELSRGKA